MHLKKSKLAVVGLGYVGLSLATEFGKKRIVIGFDIDQKRIKELKNGYDSTLEVSSENIKNSINLKLTHFIEDIKDCNIYIITIPTPVDKNNNPDLSLLKNCCAKIGPFIKKGDIIIFESTVYPGVTEEICAPIIEKESNLKFNEGFFCGYSPERINPGDKSHGITSIVKVTAGSTKKISKKVDNLYKEIITAGTYNVENIKIAEAAKIIENIQRDVNIALMNEFSIIFNKLNIDTKSVLDAAQTKWNFIPFYPGLVGGHCISVDPYYLALKSLEVGHNPEMILSGRKINDSMAYYVSEQLKILMIKKNIDVKKANILILGFSFKENCPDIRNTKVFDLINGIRRYNQNIDVYDPWVNKADIKKEYGIDIIPQPIKNKYDAIILAVAHNQFMQLSHKRIKSFGKVKHVIYDLKFILNKNESDLRL